MKKIILAAALAVTSVMFGQQITLQHTFAPNERAFAFAKGSDMVYISKGNGNSLNIYNSAFTLVKTVNVSLPAGTTMDIWYDIEQYPYAISKHIFNNDDNLEFLIETRISSSTGPAGVYTKFLLINENGVILNDFTPTAGLSFSGSYNIFHDAVSNTNNIIIKNFDINFGEQYQVFGLPTTVLAAKEIQKTNKLTAFPIPTSKILNISNPDNGSNKVEIYDATGKLVSNKIFGTNDTTIAVNVESLPNGTYFYKIGESGSKFIKN